MLASIFGTQLHLSTCAHSLDTQDKAPRLKNGYKTRASRFLRAFRCFGFLGRRLLRRRLLRRDSLHRLLLERLRKPGVDRIEVVLIYMNRKKKQNGRWNRCQNNTRLCTRSLWHVLRNRVVRKVRQALLAHLRATAWLCCRQRAQPQRCRELDHRTYTHPSRVRTSPTMRRQSRTRSRTCVVTRPS